MLSSPSQKFTTLFQMKQEKIISVFDISSIDKLATQITSLETRLKNLNMLVTKSNEKSHFSNPMQHPIVPKTVTKNNKMCRPAISNTQIPDLIKTECIRDSRTARHKKRNKNMKTLKKHLKISSSSKTVKKSLKKHSKISKSPKKVRKSSFESTHIFKKTKNCQPGPWPAISITHIPDLIQTEFNTDSRPASQARLTDPKKSTERKNSKKQKLSVKSAPKKITVRVEKCPAKTVFKCFKLSRSLGSTVHKKKYKKLSAWALACYQYYTDTRYNPN